VPRGDQIDAHAGWKPNAGTPSIAPTAPRPGAAPAIEGGGDRLAYLGEERVGVLARTAGDRGAQAQADADAPGDGEHVVAPECRRAVDGDGADGGLRGLFEEGQGARRSELPERALAGPRTLGKDERRGAAGAHARAELADCRHRPAAVGPVDQDVAAAAEGARDARDRGPEGALGNVLREVREEGLPEEGDVEHALVVRHDDVGSPGAQGRRALDADARAAQPEGRDQRPLERARHVLLRALAA